MKILLCIIIIFSCGVIGYYYKQKYVVRFELICYIKEFLSYYNSNLCLFKINAIDIIDSFKSKCSNKYLKFNKVFYKNNNIYHINSSELERFIRDENLTNILNNFLINIGKNEYEFEREKNTKIDEFLELKLRSAESDIKQKGMLYFKIALSIGAVLAILIW